MESLKKSLSLYFYHGIVLSIVTIYTLTIIDRKLMENFLADGAFFLILLLLLLWFSSILLFLQDTGQRLKDLMQRYGMGFLLSLAVATVIFVSVTPEIRVLSDESNLLSVSQSMSFERKINNVTEAAWYYRNMHPISSGMPVRPLVFPFLINIVHLLTGFRAENVFAVNFFVLWTLLFLVFFLFQKFNRTLTGITAMIFVAAQPIVSQTATSGGYELCASVFLLMSFVVLWTFLKKPSAPSFQMLWFTLLVTANIRYEGIVFLVLITILLAASKQLKPSFFTSRNGLLVWSTPVVLMPLVWQRLMPLERIFQTRENVSAYSLDHVIPNATTFFKSMFRFDFFLPYASLICILGLVGMVFFTYQVLYKNRLFEKYEYRLIGIASACFLASWFIFISYHFGKADHPSSSRYFVLFVIVFSIMAAAFLSRFSLFRKSPALLVLLAIVFFMLYHTIAIKDFFSRTQTLPRRYHFTINFFKDIAKEDNNFIVIDNFPAHYVIHRMGGVHYQQILRRDLIITWYKQHLINRIYVVEDIDYQTGESTQNKAINDKLKLIPIKELQNTGRNFVRISRAYPRVKEDQVDSEESREESTETSETAETPEPQS